jgi:hypothetical protein
MSKKLIAVAAAAALALTGLVAVPANSAGSALTVTPTGSTAGSGASSTAAFTVAVPSQDVLRSTDTASRSVLDLAVATIENNASVTVTATGAVKLLTAAQLAASTTTSATGTATLSLTSNDSGNVTFHAYNTSTSAGSITVQEVKAGAVIAANTIWVKGATAAANAYKINFTAPTTAGLESKVEFSGTVVDMFGNAIEDAALTGQTLGADAGDPTAIAFSSTKKVYEGSFTNRSTAGPVALLVNMAISADAVTAFGTKLTSQFFNVNGADLATANAALTAQVAALTAQLAESRPKATSVTKKRFNTLARKWNAANPGARVALKK